MIQLIKHNMKNIINIGKVTKCEILKIESSIRRHEEINLGLRINYKRVFKSKKTYTRKDKFKQTYA